MYTFVQISYLQHIAHSHVGFTGSILLTFALLNVSGSRVTGVIEVYKRYTIKVALHNPQNYNVT